MERSLNKRYYSCFFTGHRIIGNDELTEKVYRLILIKAEELIIHNGVDTFICGGAIGFDTLAGRAVIKLKKKYPYIKLILYIPCYDHYKKWSTEDKAIWKYIVSFSDNAMYVKQGPYEEGCMQERNKKMADDAHYCIAYCIKKGTGTGMTVKYAQAKSCNIDNLAEYI